MTFSINSNFEFVFSASHFEIGKVVFNDDYERFSVIENKIENFIDWYILPISLWDTRLI